MRSAWVREPFYKEHEGKRYCVLHHPSLEKHRDFEQAMLGKYYSKDYDFRGVFFPDTVGFHKGEFFDDADFTDAIFEGEVHFWDNIFHKKARFSQVRFKSYTTFK